MSSTKRRHAARSSGHFVLGTGLVLAVGIVTRRSYKDRASARTGASIPTAVPAPQVAPTRQAAQTAETAPAVLGPTPVLAQPDGHPPVATAARRSSRPARGVKLATRLVLAVVMFGAIAAFLFVGVGPLSGRYRVITVLSGSMRPTMPPGSLVVSVPEPVSALRVGQVVTFQAPTEQHQVVTHRVIQIIRVGDVTKIRTKGDANATPDVWTAEIQGSTVWQERTAIRNGGRLVYWFRQPAVHRITVDVIPFVLIALILWGIWGANSSSTNPAGEQPVPA